MRKKPVQPVKSGPDRSRGSGKPEQGKPGCKSNSSEILTSKKYHPDRVGVVAIGASAGGLEALERLLAVFPEDLGMAVVVIRHQDPSSESMLAELLERATHLPVYPVTEMTQVKKGHVYVNPPDAYLTIMGDTLCLHSPRKAGGLRFPIDRFLSALATDREIEAIGVILSGMGSDGTEGSRAIKKKGGVVFVQQPDDAGFTGMPDSVIDAGLADIVAPAEELAERIVQYVRRILEDKPWKHEVFEQKEIDQILLILRHRTGQDFSLYKESSFLRRLQRRMALQRITSYNDYLRRLVRDSAEVDGLFKDLLINVTGFFRDPPVWDFIRNDIFPALFSSRPDGGGLRAWIIACSTGEEAYSLAICFRESLRKIGSDQNWSLQIFATDLDAEAIETARKGVYPVSVEQEVPSSLLGQYFTKADEGYQVNPCIREMVVFAPHNVVTNAPFTQLDVISCRNLLIYLNQDVQSKLLQLFHYSLNSDGFLVLGGSESIGRATDFFRPAAGNLRIFRKISIPDATYIWNLPPVFYHTQGSFPAHREKMTTKNPQKNLQSLVHALLLQRYAPAAALVDEEGDILFASGKTGKYLEPASGNASLNILAMSRDGLGRPLRKLLAQAFAEQSTVTGNNISVKTNGGRSNVNVCVQALEESAGRPTMLLVTFDDASITAAAKDSKKTIDADTPSRVIELEEQLSDAEQKLQVMHHDNREAQEELEASNEQLQSTNEELQSTNEELMTSREELQSMNEELQSLNDELRTKVHELSRANDDMENLFDCTDIATLFLDEDLRVRRFTARTMDLFRLIPGDIGRPITDLVNDMDYPGFDSDVATVLQTLVPNEVEIETRSGEWYLTRILPYRTHQDRVDGVVITFTETTRAKILENSLHEALKVLEKRLDERNKDPESAPEILEAAVLEAEAALRAKLESHDDRDAKEPVSNRVDSGN